VSSIYLIIDSERVGKFFLRFVPSDKRHAVVTLSGQMNVMLGKYIRTQIFLIILMACVAYVILHFVFHLNYALIIAILSGMLEIIPILGPLMAISMAVIVGVSQQGVHVGCLVALCYSLRITSLFRVLLAM
jgi:predicted PurR-regulated permease PerM